MLIQNTALGEGAWEILLSIIMVAIFYYLMQILLLVVFITITAVSIKLVIKLNKVIKHKNWKRFQAYQEITYIRDLSSLANTIKENLEFYEYPWN